MSKISVTKFEQNGLELYVDESSGLAYAHLGAICRMFADVPRTTLQRRFQASPNSDVKTAEILTPGGLQGVQLYPASVVFELALEFNKDLAKRMGAAGANVFMLGLAGYQLKIDKPKTPLELAKEQVKLWERIELQEQEIKLLEEDNERQAEAIDELFEYSSIIRIAKFNKCDEKEFNWRSLKSASIRMGLEIKQVPCPRYVTKNLYHHDAWRFVYPEYRLPETTTLKLPELPDFL